MTVRISLHAVCDWCGAVVDVDEVGLEADLPLPWFMVTDPRHITAPAGTVFCGRDCARHYLERAGDRGTTYRVTMADGRPPLVVDGRGRPTRVRPTYLPAHGH